MCVACKAENRAAFHAANRDDQNLKRAARYQANRDRELARKADYAKRTQAERNAREHARRARKLRATPPWFGDFDDLAISEAHRLAEQRREATGREWAVDHMIPLQCRRASGLHVGCNVQVIPERLNATKNNRLLLTERGQWLRHL